MPIRAISSVIAAERTSGRDSFPSEKRLLRPPPQGHTDLAEILRRQRQVIDAQDYNGFVELDDAVIVGLWWLQAEILFGLKYGPPKPIWIVPVNYRYRCRTQRLAEHTAIAKGLARGDEAKSIASLQTHLWAVFADVEEIRAHKPEFFINGDEDGSFAK